MKKLFLIGMLIMTGSCIAQAQTINFPDANFKAALLRVNNNNVIAAQDSLDNYIKIDINNDGEIQVSEAQRVFKLKIRSSAIISLSGIDYFNKLTYLDCYNNRLTNLDLSALEDLKILDCSSNSIDSLNINGLVKMTSLVCNKNKLTILDVSGLSNITNLDCSYNQLTILNVSGLSNLTNLKCNNNQLTTLDVSGLSNLTDLICRSNQLTTLDVSGLSNLSNLNCYRNQLTTLDVSGLSNLSNLLCFDNQLTTLDVSGLSNLEYLDCSSNQLTTIDVSELSNLYSFECYVNQLTSLDVSGLSNLEYLDCCTNQLTSLNASGLSNLTIIACSSNQLTTLDLSGLSNLSTLYCDSNQLTSLNASGLSNLSYLSCYSNQLTTLDVSRSINLDRLYCKNNPMVFMYLKGIDYLSLNNTANGFQLYNPTLKYVCIDEENIHLIRNDFNNNDMPNVIVNSFCSTTVDGTHYTLRGNTKYDADNNGCSTNDTIFKNLKIHITNTIDSGYAIADAQGDFAMVLDSGTYTLTPQIDENYFTVSPASTTITFPEDTIPQLLCIAPNGIKHDVAISLVPTRPARPGFSDATYNLVLKNIGNQIESGTIEFKYQDDYQDYISATPTPSTTELGIVKFDFSNLQLFESKTYTLTLRTNSPADNPAVNAGDVLYIVINATIDNDEDASNNTHAIKQTVVGSFDPNDKTCLEGDIVTPDLVGDYVHYLIRFENTGTTNAENIVVTDYIDQSKFDISTLQLTSTSHSCKTTISQGNKVQFIFDNIQLPFTEPLKHGYVAFKIKTLSTLTIGDSLKNKADIYFDYNLPVATNIATSRIDNVSTGIKDKYTQTGTLSVYPNPTSTLLFVELAQEVSSPYTLLIIDLSDKVCMMETTSDRIAEIDVTHLPSGMYSLQVHNGGLFYYEKLVIRR